MMKIPTGFKIRPYDGAIESTELLARYIKTNYVEHLLDKGFWFTRTYLWKDADACEASLIPTFKKLIVQDLGNQAEYFFLSSLIEFDLKSDYGCCFSQYSAGENDGMWRAYTTKPVYGVIVVIKAQSLFESIQNQSSLFKNQYLKRVTYLSDKKAKRMMPSKCRHQKIGPDSTFDFAECHYYKRVAFEYEKEVRAVVRGDSSWLKILHKFIDDNRILLLPSSTSTPANKLYYRVDMRKSMDNYSQSDMCVLLSVEQAKEFAQMISAWFDRNELSMGIYIPFNSKNIQEIIIHPALKEFDQNYIYLKDLLNNHDLWQCTRRSRLYEEEW
jgi:hypothetical protein